MRQVPVEELHWRRALVLTRSRMTCDDSTSRVLRMWCLSPLLTVSGGSGNGSGAGATPQATMPQPTAPFHRQH